MNSALFAFPSDLADEGPAGVLDAAADRAGVDGLVLAAAYHAARDLYPHNPRGRVRALEPGVVHFRPEPARWAGRRLPARRELARGTRGSARRGCDGAGERGLAVHGWTVFLHADRLGALHPDVVPRNAFGDPYPTDLCPTHPEVRAYAVTLAAEVASRGVASVVAESLHFHPWEHGEHHERAFVPLSERARLLLGLCFCPSCLVAARAREVDGEAVPGTCPWGARAGAGGHGRASRVGRLGPGGGRPPSPPTSRPGPRRSRPSWPRSPGRWPRRAPP